MGTRYSYRKPDGTVAHYDSMEALRADNQPGDMSFRELLEFAFGMVSGIAHGLRPIYALVAFLVGALGLGVLMGATDIAVWLRFVIAAGGATVIGWLAYRFGAQVVIAAVVIAAVTLLAGVIAGGGYLPWRLVQ